MASYTYPTAHPSGTLTAEQARLALGSNRIIARRLADITQMRFIADYLLADRLDASAGGVFYETGEQTFAPANSELVAPAASYPKVVLPEGVLEAARAVKRGLGTDVTDEKLAERGGSVLVRALLKLANTVIRDVDTVAMAVISSVVTSTFASPGGAWDSAGDVVRALQAIRTQRADLGLGIDLDTVVLSGDDFATLVGMFINDGALPREAAGNPAITGSIPLDLYGFNWVTTPHYTGANPLLVDREQLGGMADQRLNSPDWATYGNSGVEGQSERVTGADKWTVRARRVTVPVVLEPLAGVQITGTGL
jgi:hypothetical protein